MRTLYQTAALALVALVAVACNGGGEQEDGAPILAPAAGGVYLALGDSVAYGNGASDPESTDYARQTWQDLIRALTSAPLTPARQA